MFVCFIVCLSFVNLFYCFFVFACLIVYLFVCLIVCLSVLLFVCLSVLLFVCLSVQLLSDEINQLRMAHSVTIAKISEHKRKQVELSHRVLKVRGRGRGGGRTHDSFLQRYFHTCTPPHVRLSCLANFPGDMFVAVH